ncbi:hypothetical protein GGX14DRAFT_640733 [Mycena pura]|uniref:RBR-type E3 ubiquitin transferase n=1 Tax=Mycena pura TaxID=153505 RepID=A0AAD7E3R0_9AGAR|nr:hypothetical protein GGX14DRAFT_640733 [Mycena pura]
MSELEILQSIYPDFISSGEFSDCVLEVPVQLGESRAVVVLPQDTDTPSETLTLSLASLPPLLLHIVQSPTYPTHGPPDLSIRSSWLPPPLVLRLHRLLRNMWKPDEHVLFDWIEFIRGGDFLTSLDLFLPSGVIEIRHPTPHHIASLFASYDDSARSAIFCQRSYSCAVCLTSVKGSKCIQLLCTHVFCRSCLDDYWSLSISEGNVEKLGCPDPQCVKIGADSSEEEIARVVSPELVKRWRWLKEKIMFEKDPTLVHCPMAFCQSPVPQPPESDSFGADRLRICSACSYSFCGFCKRTWHGAIQQCPIPQAESVVLEYLAMEPESNERERMELRYGRRILRKLVAQYQEEQLNKEWLETSTKTCPGCSLHIEKSLGCNHMTCSRCNVHFCYRCGLKLSPTSPYAHFSTTGLPCYNKLFDSAGGDPEWQPMF